MVMNVGIVELLLVELNMTKLNHAEIRELITKYHQRARDLYEGSNVKIANIKNVQLSEDGAFVEAMVFIPKSEIK
jgi:hypothetical protein